MFKKTLSNYFYGITLYIISFESKSFYYIFNPLIKNITPNNNIITPISRIIVFFYYSFYNMFLYYFNHSKSIFDIILFFGKSKLIKVNY